jgi:amidohydrolase
MNESWQAQLDRFVDARFEEMVQVRRWLHAHPEPSGKERETSLYLYQLLGDEGFQVRVGPEGRGVLADLPGAPAGVPCRRIALRADIDALHIHDAKQVDYRSCYEGVMHACGHDGHTALVLGALCALNDLGKAGGFPSPLALRGIFQPSEETSKGAKEMIQVGAMDGVDAILACHVDPSRRVGRIGVRSGVFTANCDQVLVTIVGRGGHAARPHEASDPIAAAAQLINALYLFIPRVTDSQDAVVITVGQLAGGDNANVIPEIVTLGGTVRTLDNDVRKETFEHIRRLSAGIGQTTDTKMIVRFGQSCHSICNSQPLVELITRSTRELLGADAIETIPRASMGSEDFAFYLEKAPGAMFRLGCAADRAESVSLHSPLFDIDEQCLRIGAKILARTALYGADPEFRSESL